MQEHFNGKKREKLCGCGNLFEKPEVVKARKERAEQRATATRDRSTSTRPRRRSRQPDRDWTPALEKVEEEGCCRVCKRTDRKLEAAHILGREHDEPKTGANGQPLKELIVVKDRIIPACGPFPEGCHGDVDMRRISLLPFLTLEEQLQAVSDAGGIEAARIRLAPVEHREEVQREAVSAR
jgi:hypothetical protein